MAFIAILRSTVAAMFRAPLLWLFSAVFVAANGLLSLEASTAIWFYGLCLLLIPVIILAQAGQMRVVQLHHEGRQASVLQIIRHGAGRIGPLLVVALASQLLVWSIGAPLQSAARSLLPRLPLPEALFLGSAAAIAIADPFAAFAQRGIVISDLGLAASLPMVFQALRREPATVVSVAVVSFSLRYFVRMPFPASAASPAHIAVSLLALLLAMGAQSAMFTFAYSHTAEAGARGARVDLSRRYH